MDIKSSHITFIYFFTKTYSWKFFPLKCFLIKKDKRNKMFSISMEFTKRFFILLSFLRLRKHATHRNTLPRYSTDGSRFSFKQETKNIPVFY